MGACSTKRKRSIDSPKPIGKLSEQDIIFRRFNDYLELVGDISHLGGYIQDRIKELRQIKEEMRYATTWERKIQIQKAVEIIEFLYEDKHFSQAFPILRESLHEITLSTIG
ncbi:hypothetical protein pb186bvf_008096 [Paramecium bursaria]